MKYLCIAIICISFHSLKAQNYESFNGSKEYKMKIVGYYESCMLHDYNSGDNMRLYSPLLTNLLENASEVSPEYFMKELYTASSKKNYSLLFDDSFVPPKFKKNRNHNNQNHYALIHKLELKVASTDYCIFKYLEVREGNISTNKAMCLKMTEQGWKAAKVPILNDVIFTIGNLSTKSFFSFVGRSEIENNSSIEAIRSESRSNDFVDIPKLTFRLQNIKDTKLWADLIVEEYGTEKKK